MSRNSVEAHLPRIDHSFTNDVAVGILFHNQSPELTEGLIV